jgi:predicted metal-dependent peptidase
VSDARALEAALRALRAIPAAFPELAELVPLVRLAIDARVQTTAIFPSGRLVLNRDWFLGLVPADALFVIAHELMHLSLRTHDRRGRASPRAVNIAHDYIINDLLAAALGCDIPAGGLAMPGARHYSLEGLTIRIAEAQRSGGRIAGVFRPSPGASEGAAGGALAAALGKAGLGGPAPAGEETFDVLDGAVERNWFPDETEVALAEATAAVRDAAVRAASIAALRSWLDAPLQRGSDAGGAAAMVEAIRTAYRPPWEAALQRWMEAVAPGERTFVRPSRRGADRADLVLPGRRREGWALHLVLDTSGSMASELPRILGTIASFCDGVNVAQVHIVQCDVAVTRDEWVDVERLDRVDVGGFGGSDLSAGMQRLADDPEVEVAIVLTDGYIGFPPEPMPYQVLWVVTEPGFAPPYGTVLAIDAT